MALGEELVVITQMPFAEQAGSVSRSPQQFADRTLIRVDACFRAWRAVSAEADARCVGTRQQHGPGHRADRCRIEVLESHALRREAIDIGGFEAACAVDANITVTHVVDNLRAARGQRDTRLDRTAAGCSSGLRGRAHCRGAITGIRALRERRTAGQNRQQQQSRESPAGAGVIATGAGRVTPGANFESRPHP